MENYPVEIYQNFEKAVSGSGEHFRKLLDGGYPQWAAFSNGILGDEKAVMWLLNNGYPERGVCERLRREAPVRKYSNRSAGH